jgi:DNA adenine methylase
MASKSPLRYPGGKTRAVKILETYIPEGKTTLLSPFLGGGSFELHCAQRGMQVYANDLFVPLYTFWCVLKEKPGELQRRVRARCPVTKEAFTALRKDILDLADPLDIASAYYVVNRCSFSGATFCGGFSQQAADGRMNQAAIDRLLAVNLDRVVLSNDDCVKFLNTHPQTDTSLVYADPPYYISTYVYGKDGDMHEGFDHEGFAHEIKKRTDWLLSYNDCPYIRELYSDCQIDSVRWSYGMSIKPSSEIVIRPAVGRTLGVGA